MEQASTEKLKHTGPAEKVQSGLSATKRAVGKDARAAFAKTERNRAVSSDHQIVREESLTLAREKGITAGAWRGNSGLHREGRKTPRKKGRESKKSLLKRGRRKHERVSGRKSSPGRSVESWFHSKSGQT